MQNISGSQASPEIPINENFELLSCFQVYGRKSPTTSGLVWGYWGGRWGGFQIVDGTLTLVSSVINYIVVNRSTGVISLNANNPANWDDTTNYARVYKISAAGGSVLNYEDHRVGPGGIFG
jgi:hypothetical protein